MLDLTQNCTANWNSQSFARQSLLIPNKHSIYLQILQKFEPYRKNLLYGIQ